MQKLFWALLLLSSIACEKKSNSTGAVKATPAPAEKAPTPSTEDTLLIGEVGSLTGPEAAFGISTRNGIDMAIEEANAAGGVNGKRLQVRVYDDRSMPEEAASAVTRLITQDKVKLILGEVA
jgi:branched-chain amino acid transport system substrate-binding protein